MLSVISYLLLTLVTAAQDPLTPTQLKARSRYGEASALYDQHKLEAAMKLLEEAVALDPQYENALLLLGSCASNLGQYQRASVVMLQALNLRPADTELMLHLVYLYTKVGEFDLALGFLEEAEKRLGKTPEILHKRADALFCKKDWKNAESPLLDLKTLEPQNVRVREQLAALYESSGTPQKAVRELRDLLSMKDASSAHRFHLVQVLLGMDALAEAAQELEDMSVKLPRDMPVRQVLLQLYGGPLPNSDRFKFHQARLKELQSGRR